MTAVSPAAAIGYSRINLVINARTETTLIAAELDIDDEDIVHDPAFIYDGRLIRRMPPDVVHDELVLVHPRSQRLRVRPKAWILRIPLQLANFTPFQKRSRNKHSVRGRACVMDPDERHVSHEVVDCLLGQVSFERCRYL